MKCPKCGAEIPEDTVLHFEGIAVVTGETTIRKFRNEGVVWSAKNSWDEQLTCPHCGSYVSVSGAGVK